MTNTTQTSDLHTEADYQEYATAEDARLAAVLTTTKEIVAAIVTQADAILGAKADTSAAKGAKATATDTAARLAIAAVLADVLDTVKESVKEHGADRWTAAKGAINGAAQFASKIKASDMNLPERDRADGFMVAGKAITTVTRDTLATLADHANVTEGDTPISSFLAVMREKNKARKAQAEMIVGREESAIVAWLADGKAKARAKGEAFEHQGEDATSIREVLDSAAIAKAVVDGSAMVAVQEHEARVQEAMAEVINAVHLTMANVANLSDDVLSDLADKVAAEVSNRTEPADKGKAKKTA